MYRRCCMHSSRPCVSSVVERSKRNVHVSPFPSCLPPRWEQLTVWHYIGSFFVFLLSALATHSSFVRVRYGGWVCLCVYVRVFVVCVCFASLSDVEDSRTLFSLTVAVVAVVVAAVFSLYRVLLSIHHSRPPGASRRASVCPRQRLSMGLVDLPPRRRRRTPPRASVGPQKRLRMGREHLHGSRQRRSPRRSPVGAFERLPLERRDLPPRGQRRARRRCCVDERERVPRARMVRLNEKLCRLGWVRLGSSIFFFGI